MGHFGHTEKLIDVLVRAILVHGPLWYRPNFSGNRNLDRIGILFYSVPGTWNHVTHMHLSHWSISFVYVEYIIIIK